MADPIRPLPPPPNRGMGDREEFVQVTDDFLAALPGLVDDVNAFAAEENARILESFTGSFTQTLTIGTGALAFIGPQDMALIPGHTVLITADGAAQNSMTALVSAYDPDTGSMSVDVGSVAGSGTFDDWSVGLAATANLSGYATLAGVETLTNKTLTAPVIATISNSGTITLPTGTRTLVARDTTDTLTNKTLTAPVLANPVMQGATTADQFTITDGGSVSIDPADGEVQAWTLGANRTPTLSLITAGKSVLLLVDDGSAYTITLSGVTWMNNYGVAPDLKTTGYTPILLAHLGGSLRAWLCGDQG